MSHQQQQPKEAIYWVIMPRVVRQNCEVSVRATSKEEAMTRALEMYENRYEGIRMENSITIKEPSVEDGVDAFSIIKSEDFIPGKYVTTYDDYLEEFPID